MGPGAPQQLGAARLTRARAEEGERAGHSLARRSVTHRSLGTRSGAARARRTASRAAAASPRLHPGTPRPHVGLCLHAAPRSPAPRHPSLPHPAQALLYSINPPKPTLDPTAALCCEGGGGTGGAASPAPCAHVAPARPPRCHSMPAWRGGARASASVSIKGGGTALRHLLTARWGR